MTARTLLVVALAACSGCTTELGGAGPMRQQLDEYTIARPLAQAWPDALRFLNERGFPPAGADRKVVGLPPLSSWAGGKGQETQVSGSRWTAETYADATGKRYRIIGVELGPDTCRIGFFALREQTGASPEEHRGEVMMRDPVMETAFIETFDPAGAAKIRPKDPGVF